MWALTECSASAEPDAHTLLHTASRPRPAAWSMLKLMLLTFAAAAKPADDALYSVDGRQSACEERK